MEGVIVNYRRGRKTVTMNQAVIQLKGVTSKEKAAALAGKGVTWVSPAGKELKGKVSAAHGNSGAVRAIFETGIPGQCLGTKVVVQ
ncbi:50S ribosomal protein L35ae [Candidatus Woesearchaeota archaeon]|nr:50S ribosomal protein L35ae [Candidatus Woesearchaeota archaeon]